MVSYFCVYVYSQQNYISFMSQMEKDIISILAEYKIRDEEDIKEAVECENKIERWNKFMEENIHRNLHDQFRQQLFHLNIIEFEEDRQDSIIQFVHQEMSEFQINLSKISIISIDEYKWSEKLIDDIQQSIKKRIHLHLAQSTTLNSFLQKEIHSIFDLISRKGDPKEYFDELKIFNQQCRSKSNLSNLIKQITFSDFIIFIIKFIQQKPIIGFLLNNLAVPVPVLYEVNKNVVINQQIFKNIFGVHEYSLILNIGSKKASKCGKSSFIGKLMSLKEKYLSSSHFNNILNIYTKLSFSRDTNTMLADFNGAFQKQLHPTIFLEILKFAHHASLLIIHLRQQELLNKILQTEQYVSLCSKAPKILIFVRDFEKTGLKILNRCIPQTIKQKTKLRTLYNFKTQPLQVVQMHHKQQLSFICNNNFNDLKEPKVSIAHLCDQNQKVHLSTYNVMIEQAMRQLYSKFYTKDQIIPNICKTEELSQILSKIKRENKSVERMNQYQQKQRQLNLQLKNPKLTPFIKKAIEIINFHLNCYQIFAQRLYEWRKEKTEPLRQQFLKLTEKLHDANIQSQSTRKQIVKNQEKRSHFEISIDKIMNEIIIYNNQAKDKQYQQIISNFYQRNILNVTPINIIDGKTLQFGNNPLQNLLNAISDKYAEQNKKIYVVSVVGAQSSAKSTLLNFLFRCRFETSAGRCTKGVYMSLCQMEDIVIVVLDTEGLLSVSERDIAFDHQIATFVLKISNLIIINNKGQLTSTLKQMLQVCLYVLQCLHKDQKKTDYTPQKIIFSLRDQTKPKGKFQQQMAAQIKNSLQLMRNSQNLDYRNFFSIETDDILSFPNAFIDKNGLISKTGTLTLFDQTFQKCILGMRKRIFDCLTKSPSKFSLKQFYNEASRVWETIQKCGKQIMNFKSIHQILTKRKLQEKFQQKVSDYQSIIEQNYDEYFNKINEVRPSTELEKSLYSEELSSIRCKNYGILAQLFQSNCDDICMNKEWVKQFLPKIERLCVCYENSSWQKFLKKIKRLQNVQKDDVLKDKLNSLIKNILQQNEQSNILIEKFRKERYQLLNRLRQEKKNINRSRLELQIKQVFQNLLISFKLGQLNINHIQECEDKYKRITSQQSLNSLIITKFAEALILQKDLTIWKGAYIARNQDFQKRINQCIRAKKINLPVDIQNNLRDFYQIISNTVGIFTKQIQSIDKSYLISRIQLNQPLYRICLMGKFYAVAKEQLYQIALKQASQQYQKYEKKTLQYENTLIKIIESQGNFKQILKNDFDQFKEDFIQNKTEEFKHLIQNSVDKLSLRLKPQNIFAKAMQQSLLKNDITDKKYHYIQCFKAVKNINAFLFQIMSQYPQISTRGATILEATDQIIKLANQELIQFINTLQTFLDIEDSSDQKFKQFLLAKNMIGLANLRKEIKIETLIQTILKKVKQQIKNITDEIVERINQREPEQIIIQYIEGVLKNKVLGCQFCCPMCGMKCMLPSLHEGGHHVLQNCHSLAAFSGCKYQQSEEAVLQVCQQKENITASWKSGIKWFENLKKMIDDSYPLWSQDFPNITQQEKFQKFPEIIKLHRIWANIQKAMINTQFRYLKPSTKQSIIRLKDQFQLTEEDMQRQYESPLTKEIYELGDY